MAADIVPELLEKIRNDFMIAISGDRQIQKFLKKIRDGTANMDETSLFARSLGDILAEVLKRDITQDILPNGRMYYNIANRIIKPMLEDNFNMTNKAAGMVQAILDAQDGLHLNAMSGTFPEERVNTLIGAISEEGIEWEEVEKRMDEPVRNISQSFMDEFIQTNARFRYQAGMRAQIERKLAGGACEWCKRLAGTYEYPDVPDDVYRRHDNCRCTVTFKSERQRQNIWTKQSWSTSEQLEQRKEAGLDLTRRTREEARKKEEELLEDMKQ